MFRFSRAFGKFFFNLYFVLVCILLISPPFRLINNFITILITLVLPAILGIASAGALWAMACMCAKQLRARARKQQQQHHEAATYPFQPTRRPTAVRSPSGQPPHYLKKSPSPTGNKQLSSLLSSSNGVIANDSNGCSSTPAGATPQGLKYMQENELMMAKNAGRSSSLHHHYQQQQQQQHNFQQQQLTNGLEGSTNQLLNGDQLTAAHQTDNMLGIPLEQFGKLGTIFFKLRYINERNALMVSIIRCRGLPSKNSANNSISSLTNHNKHHGSHNGTIANGKGAGSASDMNGGAVVSANGRNQLATDPYVKLQLLPDKQHKVKTRVVRNTCNPVYDEDFTFYGLNIEDLQNMSLHFVILSFDRYSRDDVIGEVICPLSSLEIGDIAKEALSISKEIQPRNLKIRTQGRGELLISLCWQPAAGRLTVVLLKARNLPRMDVTGLADPYVKIYLLYNGQRIAKKKTHVKKRTLSPVFNESFAFDIPTTEVSLVTVFLHYFLPFLSSSYIFYR